MKIFPWPWPWPGEPGTHTLLRILKYSWILWQNRRQKTGFSRKIVVWCQNSRYQYFFHSTLFTYFNLAVFELSFYVSTPWLNLCRKKFITWSSIGNHASNQQWPHTVPTTVNSLTQLRFSNESTVSTRQLDPKFPKIFCFSGASNLRLF